MILYDVIIIGGGPSGSTAASFLAEYGHKVLLLEKEKFPREHIGESLIPASYPTLERLGVLNDLKKISPRKPGVHFINSDGINQSLWCFKNALKDESYLSFHVKRSLFDKLLLDNSRKKGAEVKEEITVKNVILDNPNGIVEVIAIDNNAKQHVFNAKFLIDASGLSTFLGSKLGVKKPVKDLDRVAVWSHWSNAKFDIPLQQGAIKIIYLGGNEKKGWVWVIPISSNNLSVGVVVNNSYLKKEKERIQNSKPNADWKHDFYMSEIEDSPELKKILSEANISHKVQINGDYSYYCETKYGTNFAMIGDAGAFLDPIFSSGIFVGMYSAELVADALHAKLTSNNQKILADVYENINGAVGLVEKFVKLFYSPEIINFSNMGDPEKLMQYKKTESVYAIFHYLLSGDFFRNYKKYTEFIDTMRDQKMLAKFQNLINHSKDTAENANCGELFEEMYGEMTHEVKFAETLF